LGAISDFWGKAACVRVVSVYQRHGAVEGRVCQSSAAQARVPSPKSAILPAHRLLLFESMKSYHIKQSSTPRRSTGSALRMGSGLRSLVIVTERYKGQISPSDYEPLAISLVEYIGNAMARVGDKKLTVLQIYVDL